MACRSCVVPALARLAWATEIASCRWPNVASTRAKVSTTAMLFPPVISYARSWIEIVYHPPLSSNRQRR